MSVSGKVLMTVSVTESVAEGAGPNATKEHRINVLKRITNGTGNSQSDLAASKKATISTDTDVNLLTDLDFVGANFTATHISYLAVINNSSDETLTVGGASSNAWEPWAGATGDTVKIFPGGFHIFAAPSTDDMPIASGSTDELKLSPSGELEYELVAVGRSA